MSPSRPASAPLAAAALLVVACGLFLAGNGSVGVVDRDEARFALAAREMALRGDLVVPTNWGEPRYHKPILAYWLALGSRAILGPGEFSLRLPSVLCGLVVLLLTMRLARRAYGGGVALRAGAILGTSLLFVVESKVMTADAALLAATTASFAAWFELRAGTPHRRAWQTVFWAGVGLGILAKVVNVAFLAGAGCALTFLDPSFPRRGRVAVLAALAAGSILAALPATSVAGPLVLGVLGAWFLGRSLRSPGGRAAWSATGFGFGVPLALAIAAVWVVPAGLRTGGGIVREGLGHHLLGRTATPFEGHAGLPGYYVVAAALTFFPWAFLFPSALGAAWRGRARAGGGPGAARSPVPFLLAWILGPWALVELISSKLPHYTLVAAPALAILAALEWERRTAPASLLVPPPAPPPPRGRRLVEGGILALPLLAAALAAGMVGVRIEAPAVRAAAWALSLGTAFWGAWVLVLLVRGAQRALFRVLFGGSVLLYGIVFLALLPALEPLRIPGRIAGRVAAVRRPGEPILLIGFHEASLGYALAGSGEVVRDRDRAGALLDDPARGALVVLEPGRRGRRLADLQARHPGPWESLGEVEGVFLPRMRTLRVRILRRPPAPPPPPPSTRPER